MGDVSTTKDAHVLSKIHCIRVIDRERVLAAGTWLNREVVNAYWLLSHHERCPVCGECCSFLTNGAGYTPICSGTLSGSCPGPDVPNWGHMNSKFNAVWLWDLCCEKKRAWMLLFGQKPADPFDYETLWTEKRRRKIAKKEVVEEKNILHLETHERAF